MVLKVICHTPPPYGRVWHNAFLRSVQAQDRSPGMRGIPQKALDPVGIPLKGGTSSTRW